MDEIWKDIPGYEGLYQVSNKGRIKSLDRIGSAGNGALRIYRGRLLKPWPAKKRCGYMYIDLSKDGISRQFRVHRLVAYAFIPNPLNLPEVNHIDHNVENNSVENLEWCTGEYNNAHRRRAGRYPLDHPPLV